MLLLLTLTPPEVGKSLVKLSRVSILTFVWSAVYGFVDGEKLRLGLDEENVVLGSGLWVVGGSLEPPKFWL